MDHTNQVRRSISALASACLLMIAACSGATDSGGTSRAVTPPQEERFDPTVARTPKPSKSLTLSPDWQPPSPTRTQAAMMKARVKPSKQYGIPTRTVGEHPSDAEIRALTRFLEPLRPVPGASSNEETDALAAALREDAHDERGIDAIERFIEAYPTSRWAPALHLNLGSLSYGTGYFQDALAHWKSAWELAKAGKDGVSEDLANLALAEYAKMNARIGRLSELEPLMAEAQSRTLMGDARVKIASAAEGVWAMKNRPGISFRCGPYAVLSVAQELKPEVAKKAAAFVERVQSPVTGFSLPEVQRMSADLGMKLQMAKRDAGAPVIVPSVVHPGARPSPLGLPSPDGSRPRLRILNPDCRTTTDVQILIRCERAA